MSLVRFRPEAPYADLAHLVERDLAKVEVAGSSPVIRSKKTMPEEISALFFLSKTEGFGMATIRRANCMELRHVRVWHQP